MDPTKRTIRKIDRDAQYFVAQALGHSSLSLSDYDMIHTVNHNPGITQEELRKKYSQDKSTIARRAAKLEKEGKVTASETAQGKRRKKIFTITDAGRTAFSSWVAQPMQADKVKNMELSRLFFAGLAKPEERLAAVRDYLRQMEETRGVLCAIEEQVRHMDPKTLPAGSDWPQVLRFQRYTIQYGIDAAEFEIGWYSRLLHELEEES